MLSNVLTVKPWTLTTNTCYMNRTQIGIQQVGHTTTLPWNMTAKAMKERFEFMDGSYYEFERFTVLPAPMRSEVLLGWDYSYKYNLCYCFCYLAKSSSYIPGLYLHNPHKEPGLTETHTAALKLGVELNKKPNVPGTVNKRILGIGLILAKSEASSPFCAGVYVPIEINKFGYRCVDLENLTGKMIYEAKLVPEAQLKRIMKKD